ncbi:aspartate kinase [Mariniphaga anaerophila]|uniref:Aspartokinase n=1 Tax=Mariniphaga anaerophila TaxID=1484053 RepID=A0A1M5BEV6_9BACT|nr:aspartate kinase [Mariniphaga anaerophila]SHF40935.1 aspartate kinase [Mariniphaga anaerophila]
MKVFKFGGASVKDPAAVRNLAKIISGYNEDLVVVISAMGKTTDLLETLAKAYFERKDNIQDIFSQFKNYHTDICNDLFGAGNIPPIVSEQFDELLEKLDKKPSLDFNFEYDQIVSFGELTSTCIVSEFLNKEGKTNRWVDARTVIRTDDMYRDATIDWVLTEEFCKETFKFNGHNLYITQGFIGSTPANLTTTLGREGSDFTAAIIGNVLNAESVSFWKDVPGVLSADPKKMEGTTKIDLLSYREAVEMTHSGAKIIHPKTMKPLHNKQIPLYVKSFLAPDNSGTVIHEIDHKILLPPIFIFRENLVLITLSPKDFSFISIEDIERVVNFLAENRVKVTLMQQSAIDLNLVLDAKDADWDWLMDELSPYYTIRYNTGLTLITIRHYTEEVLDWMVKEKDIYLEQHSRLTARMLVKE